MRRWPSADSRIPWRTTPRRSISILPMPTTITASSFIDWVATRRQSQATTKHSRYEPIISSPASIGRRLCGCSRRLICPASRQRWLPHGRSGSPAPVGRRRVQLPQPGAPAIGRRYGPPGQRTQARAREVSRERTRLLQSDSRTATGQRPSTRQTRRIAQEDRRRVAAGRAGSGLFTSGMQHNILILKQKIVQTGVLRRVQRHAALSRRR